MRKTIIAGNWKMNKTLEDGFDLVEELKKKVEEKLDDNVKMLVIPPATHIKIFSKALEDSKIEVGAQNCHEEDEGAFTGDLSVDILKSVGAEYIIVGHSERRKFYKEDNELLAKKVKKVLEKGLTPIYCCGETLEEREDEKHMEVVANQVKEGLFDLKSDEIKKVIIAYEPVWAIGTGKTATPEQAQEMHKLIRKAVAKKFEDEVADEVHILYGGSMKPGNAEDLLAQEDIDGGLIGGASLKAEDFYKIAMSAKEEE